MRVVRDGVHLASSGLDRPPPATLPMTDAAGILAPLRGYLIPGATLRSRPLWCVKLRLESPSGRNFLHQASLDTRPSSP